MPVRIVCPSCSAALSVKDELAGRALKCPKCGGVIPAAQTGGSATASPPPSKSTPALQKPAFEEITEPTKPKPGSKVTGLPAPRVKKDDDDEEPAKPAKTGSKVTGLPAPRVKKDDDDEEDEDRPRRKKRDDEEDEDRPRKKKRDDDEDEDRPRKKKRDDDEDEDEDRPRKKKRDDDEDEEGAKNKKSEKSEKGAGDEDEEGDEERPTKKRKKQDDDEDDDEDDDRPSGKKKQKKKGGKMGLIIGGIAVALLLCCLPGVGYAIYYFAFGSNNDGKIVGKWKLTAGPGMEDVKAMEALGVSMIMEFKSDGTVVMAVQANDPKMQKMLEAGGDKVSFSWKYKLNSGDDVEFYDLPKNMQDKKGGGGMFGSKDRGNVNIKIEGDNMTISDNDTMKTTPIKLTKVK